MRRTGRKTEWAVVLFCAALLLLFPPILSLYDKPDLIFGLPLAFIAIYAIWAVLILAVFIGARKTAPPSDLIDPIKPLDSDKEAS